MLPLVLAVYWRGLGGGFFFDDFPNILELSSLRLKTLTMAAVSDAWSSGIAGPLGRPLSQLSFAINYYFFGFSPFYFKLTNVLIHAINAGLIYRLLIVILRATKRYNQKETRSISAAAAILWAIHPIQVTSVLYVVQRMTSLSAMFMLLALIFHIWARQRMRWTGSEIGGYFAAWCVFFPLALLSKETGALLVLYVFAYETTLQPHYSGKYDRLGRWYIGGLLSIGISSICYVEFFQPGLINYSGRDFTLTQRVMTESRVVLDYARMIVLPSLSSFALYHDDVDISTGLLNPATTLPASLGLVVTGILAIRIRHTFPVIAFSIGWFFLGHVLESTVIPLELMHEHRNYLPSLGLILLIVLLIHRIFDRLPTRHLWLFVEGAIAIYLLLLTFQRSSMYGSDYLRTQLEAQYHPNSVRTQYEAGAILVKLYEREKSPLLLSMAIKHFDTASRLRPSFKLGLLGKLKLKCLSDGMSDPEAFAELKSRLSSVRWLPEDRMVMHGVAEMAIAGTMCLSRAEVDDLFATAKSNRTLSVQDRSVLASDYSYYLWGGQKDYEAAWHVLSEAITRNRGDVNNRLNLLELMRYYGDAEGARTIYCELVDMHMSGESLRRFHMATSELYKDGVLLEKGRVECR